MVIILFQFFPKLKVFLADKAVSLQKKGLHFEARGPWLFPKVLDGKFCTDIDWKD